MRSFCALRCSMLAHQSGRLYSHFTHKLVQAPQAGWPSSHFFLRNRHVKQPLWNDELVYTSLLPVLIFPEKEM